MHKNNDKPVLFSGIQPSGLLHIGSYIGAIKNWLKLQESYDCLFSLVDLHTITVRQDPVLFRKRCYDFLCLYLACGLDPQKSILFCQSHVLEHTQLAWVLNCYTYMGELSRMTQFKDKTKKAAQNIVAGLFNYPVLMAADILLYNTNLVPVGADQKQHVELTRDIALRFNNTYGNIFVVPKPYIAPVSDGSRIMSLLEPDKKMSKSDENLSNVIALLDSPDEVMKKMKRAVTDSGSEVKWHQDKPGVSNLLTIFAVVTDKTIEQLEQEYSGKGYGKFKMDLADAIIAFLAPIQKRYYELRNDEMALGNILNDGAKRARSRARDTLDKVLDVVGFIAV